MKRLSKEQHHAMTSFRALIGPTPWRVKHDDEGWPIIPGLLGQIEWFDTDRLAVYTGHTRMFTKLLAIPEVQRHQTGAAEIRALFPSSRLQEVATVIRARRKRSSATARHLSKTAYRSISQTEDGR